MRPLHEKVFAIDMPGLEEMMSAEQVAGAIDFALRQDPELCAPYVSR